MEKANRAAERLARTTGDPYKTVLDHTVALQERNVRFWQGTLDGVVREIREQAESNRALTRELVERAEGLRLVESGVNGGGFPIAGYDELNVAEISERLEGLTAAQIREVREYEKRNKDRDTLIEQLDRKLKAVSA